MTIHVKPRVEEVAVLALVGAVCGFAIFSPLTAGAAGYWPGAAAGWIDALRAAGFWTSGSVGALVGVVWGFYQERDTHLKGARYYAEPAEARPALQAREKCQFSDAQKKGAVRGIRIGGIEFSRRRETTHAAVTGLSGAGKTSLLFSTVDQIFKRRERAVIFDLKGDMAERYFDPATCAMVGPWDARAAVWNAPRDFDSPERVEQFAAAVCEVEKAQGDNKYFYEGAAAVFAGLLKSYMLDDPPGRSATEPEPARQFLREWAALEALPGYSRESVPAEALEDGEVVGQYSMDGELRPCAVDGCGKPHRHGFMVRLADGSLRSIGGTCGQVHLGARWEKMVRRYEAPLPNRRNGHTWTWADLRDALTLDPVALVQRAALGDPQIRSDFASVFPPPGSDTPPYIDPRGGGQLLSTLTKKTRWIVSYATVAAKDTHRETFSVLDWMLKRGHVEKQIVFLNFDKLYAIKAQQIFGAIMDVFAAAAASNRMPEIGADEPGTWFVLDEFAKLGAGAVAATKDIMELGRSRGCRVMVFWQSKKQMVELLGRDRGESLLEQPVTSIYMTMAPGSAKAVSDAIGERQIDRIENAPQNGAVGGKTKRTINEPVIFPSELTGLAARTESTPKGVELIVHLVGAGVLGKLVNPFPEYRDPIAKPFVESETWKRGSLPDVTAEAAEAAPASEARTDGDAEADEAGEDDESNEAGWSGL